SARVFATYAGLTVAHCNHDSTGGFSDTSGYGSHCHVDVRGPTGAFRPAEAWPADLREGYRFGVLAGTLVATRTDAGREVLVSPSEAPPADVVMGEADLSFADGGLDGGAILVASRGELTVLRPH